LIKILPSKPQPSEHAKYWLPKNLREAVLQNEKILNGHILKEGKYTFLVVP